MMRNLALLIAAWMHEPTRFDYYRFGLDVMPAWSGDGCVSPMRCDWRWTCRQLECAVKTRDPDRIQEAAWRERCFYYFDDFVDANRPPGVRDEAARQLKLLIGPVAYYSGKMPTPWMED